MSQAGDVAALYASFNEAHRNALDSHHDAERWRRHRGQMATLLESLKRLSHNNDRKSRRRVALHTTLESVPGESNED